jgi:hypothetical protein
MEANGQKPINVISSKVTSRRDLAEAFKFWAEALPAHATVAVQYSYDSEAHVRGFQVFFDEAANTKLLGQPERAAKQPPEAFGPNVAA